MTANAPTYEFHQAGFLGSRRVRCRLELDELTVEIEGKRPVRIPYQDITGVRLSSRAHGRNEAMMHVRDFRCRVSAHRQVIEITNRSDRGVGRAYQYHNQAFGSFVHELHRRLLPFEKRVRFHSGHALYYRLVLTSAVVAAILGPFGLASYGEHLSFGIATYLSAVTGLFVAACRLRLRGYAPTKIPEELLPTEEDQGGVMA